MIQLAVLLSVGGILTIVVLVITGIFGFAVGIGNSGFFIAPREKWVSSPADMSTQRTKIGCVMALVFMVLAGWVIVSIFG